MSGRGGALRIRAARWYTVACDAGSRLVAYDVHTRRPADVIIAELAREVPAVLPDRPEMFAGPRLTRRGRAGGRLEGFVAHRIGLPVSRVCGSGYSSSVHPVLR
jgi:hypothetical protein